MRIAILGWGSLIWQPKNLLIQREWFSDGPFLPIEFARQSQDGRLTLVIAETAKPIRTLWALMATEDLDTAINSLLVREGIPIKNLNGSIGSIISTEETEDDVKLIIKDWANRLGLDAVIWTNLPAKFQGTNKRVPNLTEAIDYLKSLDVNAKSNAEEYIRNTPRQIDTDYRRKFETEFGWTFVS